MIYGFVSADSRDESLFYFTHCVYLQWTNVFLVTHCSLSNWENWCLSSLTVAAVKELAWHFLHLQGLDIWKDSRYLTRTGTRFFHSRVLTCLHRVSNIKQVYGTWQLTSGEETFAERANVIMDWNKAKTMVQDTDESCSFVPQYFVSVIVIARTEVT